MASLLPLPIPDAEARTSSPGRTSRGNTPLKPRTFNRTPDKRSSSVTKATYRLTNGIGEPKRSSSTRKVRRWENASLFGLPSEIHEHLLAEYLENHDIEHSAFHVETKTTFQTMLAPENMDIVERFRRGEEMTLFKTLRTPKLKTNPIESIQVIMQRAFDGIEKRLRGVLVEKVVSSPSWLAYLRQCEELLFAYGKNTLHNLDIHVIDGLECEYTLTDKGELVLHFLHADRESTADNRSRGRSVSQSTSINNNHSNHAFHRLLLHALCQFHCLSSKSYDDPHNQRGRFMLINKNHKKPQTTLMQGLSLVEYLCTKYTKQSGCDMLLSRSPDSVVDVLTVRVVDSCLLMKEKAVVEEEEEFVLVEVDEDDEEEEGGVQRVENQGEGEGEEGGVNAHEENKS